MIDNLSTFHSHRKVAYLENICFFTRILEAVPRQFHDGTIQRKILKWKKVKEENGKWIYFLAIVVSDLILELCSVNWRVAISSKKCTVILKKETAIAMK